MQHVGICLLICFFSFFSGAKELTKQELIRELTGKEAWSDLDFYGRIVQLSRENKTSEVLSSIKSFERDFAQSSLIPNVKIIQAKAFVTQGKFGRAIATLDFIEKNHPNSAKMPSVVLLKSQIYERWGLHDLASEKRQQVIRRFAGSPESFQAGYSLKTTR